MGHAMEPSRGSKSTRALAGNVVDYRDVQEVPKRDPTAG